MGGMSSFSELVYFMGRFSMFDNSFYLMPAAFASLGATLSSN
jgi:hypothetical protein